MELTQWAAVITTVGRIKVAPHWNTFSVTDPSLLVLEVRMAIIQGYSPNTVSVLSEEPPVILLFRPLDLLTPHSVNSSNPPWFPPPWFPPPWFPPPWLDVGLGVGGF
uniref:Uncharacterized protein n=1 Tax=Cacopsylla melanoneura TaxID=428564 RepID=A0A8D8LTU4_9HEMI